MAMTGNNDSIAGFVGYRYPGYAYCRIIFR